MHKRWLLSVFNRPLGKERFLVHVVILRLAGVVCVCVCVCVCVFTCLYRCFICMVLVVFRDTALGVWFL